MTGRIPRGVCKGLAGAVTAAVLAFAMGVGNQALAQKTIRVITTGEPYSEAMKVAVKTFTERTGIDVVIDSFPYEQTYNKEVLIGSSGSDEYDVMVIDCIWLPIFMKNKWVQSLEPFEAKGGGIDWNGFVPGSVEAYDIWEAERYATPIDFFIEVLAYRADKFAEAGLTRPPETWNEFREYAAKLNDPDNNFYGVITFPGEQDSGYSEWTVRLAGMKLPPNSNQFVWNKEFHPVVSFENQGVRALEQWLEIRPYVAPGANEMGYAESINALAQGEGAMYMSWYMMFSDVENPEMSKVVGKIKYALPPRTPGEGPKYEYLGGFQIAISANAQNPDEAYQFIAWITSDEGQELMLEHGAPGAYKAYVYDDPKWLKRYPFLAPVNDVEVLVPLTSDFAEYVEMQRIVYDQIFAAWVGDKSSEEALKATERSLAQLYKDLGYAK